MRMTKMNLHVEALLTHSTNLIDYVHLSHTVKCSLSTKSYRFVYAVFLFSIQFCTPYQLFRQLMKYFISLLWFWVQKFVHLRKKKKKNCSGQYFKRKFFFVKNCPYFIFCGKNLFFLSKRATVFIVDFPMAASFVLLRQWELLCVNQCGAQTQTHEFYQNSCWLKNKPYFARTASSLGIDFNWKFK